MSEIERAESVNMDEDELSRLREAFAARAGLPRDDCPDPVKFWEAIRGEASSDDVERLVEHTIGCAACAEDWRLARHLVAETGMRDVVVSRAESDRQLPWMWSRWGILLASAATVFVAIGLVGYFRPHSAGPTPPAYREASSRSIESLLPDNATVSRTRCVLRWSPGPAGSRYDVRVATDDLTLVESARNLEKTEHQVPAEALAAFPAGMRLVWQVEAILPDGARLRSPAFILRLD